MEVSRYQGGHMPSHALRFGIVGPGSIAHLHGLAIRQASGAELTAVCGRDEKNTRGFAEQFGITAYTDLGAFLSSKTVDAVSIAAPSGDHLRLGALAARHGKHVLCEKPLEVTPGKAAQFIDACADNGVQLGVYFQARFDECTRLAKQAITSGRLGKILFASCQMRWYRSQAYYDSAAWRGTWALDGGGCLMNQGIHSLDLLLHLVGDPAEVSAYQGPRTHKGIEVEDNLCAAVRYGNGAIGTIEASTSCSPGFPRRVEISGDRGSIGIEDNRIIRWTFDTLDAEDSRIFDLINAGGKTVGGAADPTAIDVTGHRLVVEDFVRSVRENRAPFIDGVAGKKAVDFVCAVYESLRSGKPESLK
jgi:UDP-N-acetyl-2-amino-2-deoxyglucuronate dehydrogenase